MKKPHWCKQHTVVIVVLGRELFRAKLVALHNLLARLSCLEVAKTVEHDFRDHRVVWNHHCNSTE